jgi:hypothetical protein
VIDGIIIIEVTVSSVVRERRYASDAVILIRISSIAGGSATSPGKSEIQPGDGPQWRHCGRKRQLHVRHDLRYLPESISASREQS